jgi:hypothetical protein
VSPLLALISGRFLTSDGKGIVTTRSSRIGLEELPACAPKLEPPRRPGRLLPVHLIRMVLLLISEALGSWRMYEMGSKIEHTSGR